MWGPVVQNATWKNAASALAKVPEAIDWVSLDYYRTTPSAWQTPEKEYAAQVYPKMAPHQRALQVPQVSGLALCIAALLSSKAAHSAVLPRVSEAICPQAFGRKHDLCADTCYMNASQKGCCETPCFPRRT